MRALNFYSSNYHGHLLGRRKTCTIRLGDKTNKYTEGDVIWITIGDRFSPRKKVFTAVLDKVEYKKVADLTEDEVHGESPDFKGKADLVACLTEIYGHEISNDTGVTVICFSEVIE